MDHPSGPLSAEEHDRVETLVDRFVQNYERLHENVMLTGMELTLLSPHVSDQEDGVEVLRALRAVRVAPNGWVRTARPSTERPGPGPGHGGRHRLRAGSANGSTAPRPATSRSARNARGNGPGLLARFDVGECIYWRECLHNIQQGDCRPVVSYWELFIADDSRTVPSSTGGHRIQRSVHVFTLQAICRQAPGLVLDSQ